ncbi:MAG TPA: PDZ domain-containing protein [Gemmatimonadales bacterium]|jgi:predicted metalloprotease with PDZ domain
MNSLALLLAVFAPAHPHPRPVVKEVVQYTLRVDSTDLSGWTIEMRFQNKSGTFRLAMAAHPEYDDRYWRYVRDVAVEPGGTITRVDSAVWQFSAPEGWVTVRYRVALLPPEPGPRASWRPFLTATGGLVGGPHAFMYLLGAETMPQAVILSLPSSWEVATGLTSSMPRAPNAVKTGTPRMWGFIAPDAAALIDSPMLVGRLRQWSFVEGGRPHRVVYWPLPDATPFDTSRFVASIRSLVHQTIELFGGAPYREYTFLFEDGAHSGGLEHRNSVTLGALSSDLSRDPNAVIQETAHEFIHTWNLMAIKPIEYRDIDYRTQAPVSSLWFSEGLTMYYADLLLRRAGIPLRDSTRQAHLERLIGSYLFNPAYARFSAESISRVAYNVDPGELGDYSASTHLQGELIGTMLDLVVRNSTNGQRSLDDVMRLLFSRVEPIRPPPSRAVPSPYRVDGRTIEQAVESVCGCDVTPFFDAHVRGAGAIDFDRYLALIGLKTDVTWAPAMYNGAPDRDLRVWGWQSERDSIVRLLITNPASIWGRAGLHSRDQLVTMNGVAVTTWSELRAKLQSLRIGDTVRVQVRRPSGPFAATVIVAGFQRPTVRIAELPNATVAQRRLAEAVALK